MRFEIGNLQLFGLDLSALFQRWRMGLQDMLPAGLAGAFVNPAPTVAAIVEQDSVRFVREHPAQGFVPAKGVAIVTLQQSEMKLATDGVLKADVIGSGKEAQLQLNLVIPEKHVMRRRISLPKVARHNLRNMVSFQVGRLTPFSTDQVFFDVIELPATANDDVIEVELIAVLKSVAQPWIDEVERLTGLSVARLKVPNTEQQYVGDINLFAQLRGPNAWWLRLNRNSMLLFVLAVLLCATALTPVIKLRAAVVERKQEIQVIDRRVADLQVKREVLEQDLASLNYVLEQRVTSGLPSRVIEELTRLIPDEIYINNLSVQKKTVVLSGIGTGVVDLIELLNSSPLFAEAKFTASITRGSAGQDIFTASVQLTTAMDEQ